MDYQTFKKNHIILDNVNGVQIPKFNFNPDNGFFMVKHILIHFIDYDSKDRISLLIKLIHKLSPHQYTKFSISKENETILLTNDKYADKCKLLLDKWHLKEDKRIISVLAANAGIEPLLHLTGIESYDYDNERYFPFSCNKNFIFLDTEMNQVMLIGANETYIFELQNFPAIEKYSTDAIMSFLSNWQRFLLEFDNNIKV